MGTPIIRNGGIRVLILCIIISYRLGIYEVRRSNLNCLLKDASQNERKIVSYDQNDFNNSLLPFQLRIILFSNRYIRIILNHMVDGHVNRQNYVGIQMCV